MTGKLVELILTLRKLQNTDVAESATAAIELVKTIAADVDKLEQQNTDYRHRLAMIQRAVEINERGIVM